MTQLYNRNLLSIFDTEQFHRIVDDALTWLNKEQDTTIPPEIRKALSQRLLFRREFLSGLDQDMDVLETRSMKNFQASVPFVSQIEESMSLGKPVEEAFSLKLQRKLASTVPPRPMVKIDSKEAITHMRRLCEDAADVLQMLDYRGPYNLRVRFYRLIAYIKMCTLTEPSEGNRMGPTIPQATAVCLHPFTRPVSARQRYEDDWLSSRQAVLLQ